MLAVQLFIQYLVNTTNRVLFKHTQRGGSPGRRTGVGGTGTSVVSNLLLLVPVPVLVPVQLGLLYSDFKVVQFLFPHVAE